MATIILQSYAVNEKTAVGVSINLHLGADNPFPTERFEATRLCDVQSAFDDYLGRARATGKPMKITATIGKGRKPIGFDRNTFDVDVNV